MGDIERWTRWAAAFEVQVVAKDIIDWVYGLQVLPLNGDGNSTFEDEALYGVRGSTSIGLHFSSCGVGFLYLSLVPFCQFSKM
jgi:hypothetical protein